MIQYIEKTNVTVKLQNKIIGTIKKVKDGYQYFPKGSKKGGTIHKNINVVKQILEGIVYYGKWKNII